MTRWLGAAAAALTLGFAQLLGVATISVPGVAPPVVTVMPFVAAFACLCEWNRETGRFGSEPSCDAPNCTAAATVDVSDETSFCPVCAVEYYAAGERGDR